MSVAKESKFIFGLQVPKNLDRYGFDSPCDHRFVEKNINDAREVIQRYFRKTSTVREYMSSSSLKDLVQELCKQQGTNNYIANGEFIVAMYAEGFQVRKNDINAFFNIEQGSIETLQDVVRLGRKSKKLIGMLEQSNNVLSVVS